MKDVVRRALTALYLEVPRQVAEDVERVVTEEIERLETLVTEEWVCPKDECQKMHAAINECEHCGGLKVKVTKKVIENE
jgi:hypothetical protein